MIREDTLIQQIKNFTVAEINSKISDGDIPQTKADIGLGSVEDKSSATIRSEIIDSDIPSTITRDSELSSVATSGSYDDLVNKPILAATVTVSSAQIITSNTNPVELIAAPGASKWINIHNIAFSIDFNTTAYDTNTTILFTIGAQQVTGLYAGILNAVTDVAGQIGNSESAVTPINAGLFFKTQTGDPSNGDSSLKVKIYYTIEDI